MTQLVSLIAGLIYRKILLPISMVADQPLLGHGGGQLAVLGKNPADAQSPGLAGAGAVDGVKQPLVHAKGAVEPHGVVQAGHLHFRLPESVAVGVERGGHQVEVRRIGQHVAMGLPASPGRKK